MPVSQALVTRFFQLIVNRQYTEAERELERVKQRLQKTDWNKGYFRGLYGMYLSRRANGDGYSFFSRIDMTDRAALHAYRREFLEHVGSRVHGDFDKGFFSAWADCMRVLSRMEIPASMNSANDKAEDSKLRTVKSDESQATIENFLNENAD